MLGEGVVGVESPRVMSREAGGEGSLLGRLEARGYTEARLQCGIPGLS